MGRETAIQLWEQFKGIDAVWAIGRRADRLEELKRSIGVPVRAFALDLTGEEGRQVLKNALDAEKPKVKFLVNAAGFGKIGQAENLPVTQQAGMAELNCAALAAVTALVLPDRKSVV